MPLCHCQEAPAHLCTPSALQSPPQASPKSHHRLPDPSTGWLSAGTACRGHPALTVKPLGAVEAPWVHSGVCEGSQDGRTTVRRRAVPWCNHHPGTLCPVPRAPGGSVQNSVISKPWSERSSPYLLPHLQAASTISCANPATGPCSCRAAPQRHVPTSPACSRVAIPALSCSFSRQKQSWGRFV